MTVFFYKQTFSSDLVFLLLRLTGKKSVTFLFWETLLSALKQFKKNPDSHDFSTFYENRNNSRKSIHLTASHFCE